MQSGPKIASDPTSSTIRTGIRWRDVAAVGPSVIASSVIPSLLARPP